jgi:phosphate transport system substrate-binding protein
MCVRRILTVSSILILALCACPITGFTQQTITLVGSGGSSPVPLFHIWSSEFNKRQPTLQMDYVVLGTSDSIAQIAKGSGDFGAGDVPLSPEERGSGDLVELPITLIGIVPIYNVPGAEEKLRFSGKLLAQIYLGEVKNWNSREIAELNPRVHLPDLPIKVVYRTPGKGTNYIMTEFLSKTSPKFREKVGRSISPRWPVGVAAERSSDMADKVKNEPGAIGYAELQYARESKISFGLVQNAEGKFIEASPESLLAAANAVEAPSWDKFTASLTYAPGADSYPLTSLSWIYARKVAVNPARRTGLLDLLSWIMIDGQKLVLGGYSPLPPLLAKSVKTRLETLR